MNLQVFSRYHNEGLLRVISARGRELSEGNGESVLGFFDKLRRTAEKSFVILPPPD